MISITENKKLSEIKNIKRLAKSFLMIDSLKEKGKSKAFQINIKKGKPSKGKAVEITLSDDQVSDIISSAEMLNGKPLSFSESIKLLSKGIVLIKK